MFTKSFQKTASNKTLDTLPALHKKKTIINFYFDLLDIKYSSIKTENNFSFLLLVLLETFSSSVGPQYLTQQTNGSSLATKSKMRPNLLFSQVTHTIEIAIISPLL